MHCIVCNNCYSGKAINVTNSVFVLVALSIQHTMRMRRNMFISVASVDVPYCSALSHKILDFGKHA
jgi:hypothetical protein